ncbi:hypothetical protein OG819_22250 [Streptomyces sp. NBC_01549]|uniref:DUF6907 domain-containing protein n=1 Tax=Streptomyces sp. NBC_01549 TaxID=2975874 RepID=UPI0022536027|nr:hypothetical protein [Streptomyces sp. NBC_01549]MCX4592353.1 hypothetical protein [Streptomyces sp. NBC_01549]
MTTNVTPFPAITPGYQLVPAKVGRRNATSAIVYIECPTWCVVDHVGEPEVSVEDITHSTNDTSIVTHSLDSRGIVHVLMAMLKTDPTAEDTRLREAHIVLDDETNFACLTPEMAEKLADDVIGFASELRHMARTARLHNRPTPDSDPNMDEALRRVRGGRA